MVLQAQAHPVPCLSGDDQSNHRVIQNVLPGRVLLRLRVLLKMLRRDSIELDQQFEPQGRSGIEPQTVSLCRFCM